ncbi:MAG: LuxR C-terminal-related transcriptional regulator [Pseudomonadota bacterium]|jgi:two-component system nitrate/nitrite response regulator NarL|nr:response regulator transcription factor [Burkholderiales bacterium]MCA3253638.1 response regulator transcription factor [Rubrivivax sp.]MCA3260224.1 response regulator transcription factor [Rubrivivax sp.]MCZ8031201.1 response regulator transcription factor [Rubrivivax sp.]
MKILIVEDHPVMLEGLRGLVRHAFPGQEPAHAGSFAAAREQCVGDLRLVLLDPGLPDLRGVAAIRGMKGALANCPLVVVSADDNPHCVQMAWEAGAQGFISKAAAPSDIVQCLREIADGKRMLLTRDVVARLDPVESVESGGALSDRQLQVLQALCEGLANKEIAQRLRIAEKTVKVHVGAIFEKLGVVNRTQASMAARRLGLVRDGEPGPVTSRRLCDGGAAH